MKNTMQQTAEKVEVKKRTKMPTVFLSTANITENIRSEVIDTLEEGLAHLDINLIKGEISEMNLDKSHIIVMFDEDENTLRKAWKHGVVPVTKGFIEEVVDYNPNTESGNSFIYKSLNHWEIFAAIVRACETYKFPYDWKFIVRSCTKSV